MFDGRAAAWGRSRLLVGGAAGLVGRRRLRRGSGGQNQQQRCERKGERPQGEQAVFLFRRPTGLADGLTLKEPASRATTARLAPTTWVPRPLATNERLGLCGNLYEAAVLCPVLRATWGVAPFQPVIGQQGRRLECWRLRTHDADPLRLGQRAFSRAGRRCTLRASWPVAAAVATATPDAARDPARLGPDRRRGARRRAAARLPGLRDQEHDAGRRRRRDRRRRRGRAGHVSLAHARVAAGGGDPGRGARLAHRHRRVGARRAADPRADPVRRRRHDPGRDQGRAGRAAADRLQGGGRRAGHPRRDEGARRGLQDDRRRGRQPGRAGRRPWTGCARRPRASRRPRSWSPPPTAPSTRCPPPAGRPSPATRCCGSGRPACRRRPRRR